MGSDEFGGDAEGVEAASSQAWRPLRNPSCSRRGWGGRRASRSRASRWGLRHCGSSGYSSSGSVSGTRDGAGGVGLGSGAGGAFSLLMVEPFRILANVTQLVKVWRLIAPCIGRS